MLKFNRKTEYALIALRYMANKGDRDQVVSAREISAAYRIPHPVLSKVLQRLQVSGIIASVQGTKGGYRILRPFDEVSLKDLVEIFEGPIGVTDCAPASFAPCVLTDVCNVRSLFGSLNGRIAKMLGEITLEELQGFESTAVSQQPEVTAGGKA